jgi:hypothetical protein
MNYQNLYCWLVINRLNSPLPKEESTEEHHVLPESLCGPLESEDRILREFLVPLTPKEHYIAHHLLLKIYPKESKERKSMFYAFNYMCHSPSNKGRSEYKITARTFEMLRNMARTDSMISQKGKKRSLETRAKMSKAKLGTKASEETKRKMSISRLGKKLTPKTDEQKRRLSDAQKGNRWLYNPITNKSINVKGDKITVLLQKGYIFGRGPNFNIANNIKKYNKEHVITDELRKKFSDLRTGRVWIHNPITKQRKFVKGKVLEECLNSKIYVLGTGKIKMDHK